VGVLEGKNIIVINADQGIYLDVVLAVAQEGANVACHISELPDDATDGRRSRFMGDFEHAAKSTRARTKMLLFPADLSTEEGVEAFFNTVLDQFSDFHGLIYCQEDPGSTQRKPLAELSLEEWNRDLCHYLRKPFFALRQALDEFLIAGGRIVHIAPIAQAGSGQASYRATQTALHAFHRSIVKEYGARNVACNLVFFNPHLTADPVAVHTMKHPFLGHKELESAQAQSRPMIELVIFLVSDAASYINGEVFHLSDVGSQAP
jgi:NAD(P)-dependent dehydrogenase (short-subunit alcohol dehydrogenase family)